MATLLDLDGVARILGVSRIGASRMVRYSKDFPKPVVSTSRLTWWLAQEVVAYRLWTPEPEPAFPAPSVPRRPAQPQEVPTGASRLVRAAGAGWRARATVASGHVPDRYGRPSPAEVVSVAVTLRHRDGRRAVGVWEDGKFKAGFLFGKGRLEKVGATALKEEVSGGG